MITALEHNRRNGGPSRPPHELPQGGLFDEPGKPVLGHVGETPAQLFESMMKAMGFKFVTVKAGNPRRKKSQK